MKKLLVLISLVLVSGITVAQDRINNFKVDNNQLIWKKVYDTTISSDTMSFDKLVSDAKCSAGFDVI